MDNNMEVKSLVGASSEEVAQFIYDVLDSKKGKNVKTIKVGEKTVIADYFVIANGTSTTHTRGLADEVDYQLGEKGENPDHIEGIDGASWIAMDYHDIVVHVFYKDTRDTYSLEKLWSDGENIDISTLM